MCNLTKGENYYKRDRNMNYRDRNRNFSYRNQNFRDRKNKYCRRDRKNDRLALKIGFGFIGSEIFRGLNRL